MQGSSNQAQSENTYLIDAESGAEMARLLQQDRLLTRQMGMLPERPDFADIHRVLDIACGPGGWVQEVAFAHPRIEVVGIDISQTMIDYARSQAKVQGLGNAYFRVMNALEPLDFPDNYFDLINARGLIGFMLPAAWPGLMRECLRVTRPAGFIRLTECDDWGTTTSPAFEKLWGMFTRAHWLAGRSFSPEGRNFGITPRLRYFLQAAGYHKIRNRVHPLDYSAGTEAHAGHYQNWRVGLKLLQPFLIKMKVATQEEAEMLYQQALAEMLSDDFCAMWFSLSVWGEKPIDHTGAS